MSWKRYQNELIAFFAFIFMISSFFYKQHHIHMAKNTLQEEIQSLNELKELIALKKVWADKKTTKKIEKLKILVSPSKVIWRKEGKKVKASFKNLTARELNKVVSKILNTAVIIEKFNIELVDKSYNLELKCKW